jgi:hypothetical protein
MASLQADGNQGRRRPRARARTGACSLVSNIGPTQNYESVSSHRHRHYRTEMSSRKPLQPQGKGSRNARRDASSQPRAAAFPLSSVTLRARGSVKLAPWQVREGHIGLQATATISSLPRAGSTLWVTTGRARYRSAGRVPGRSRGDAQTTSRPARAGWRKGSAQRMSPPNLLPRSGVYPTHSM